MNRLRILMADDQQEEIDAARKALKEMNHDVDAIATFDEAKNRAETVDYDIAVVDLGWYTDKALKSQLKEDVAAAGWIILNSTRNKNPDTVRILYSKRTDEPQITQTATEQKIICIQKRYTKEGRLELADVVKAIANQLSIRNDLKNRLKEMEIDLEKTRDLVKELQDNQSKDDSEERRFRRVILTTLVTPTLAFILFIAAWLITRQVYVAIAAFLGGGFLSLLILRAIRVINSADLKYMGDLLPKLFNKPEGK